MTLSPIELLEQIDNLEKSILKKAFVKGRKNVDVKTTKNLAVLFANIRKYVSYRNNIEPINIEDDGHLFECPRCHVKYQSDDGTVDEFIFCPGCGQRFRDGYIEEDIS